jgi:hypothetical protein
MHELVDEKGLNIIGVAELAHVELDGDQVALLHAVERARGLIEHLSAGQQAMGRVPRDKVNGHEKG